MEPHPFSLTSQTCSFYYSFVDWVGMFVTVRHVRFGETLQVAHPAFARVRDQFSACTRKVAESGSDGQAEILRSVRAIPLETLRRHSARSSVVLASPGSESSPQRQQTRDANHSNCNKAADHGERIFVDFQHTAPHREIASDQPDCRRLGSKFLWLRCNDPIFYCGKKMAETRVIRTDDLRNRSWEPSSPRRHPTRWHSS
jgi:hypothetical protein